MSRFGGVPQPISYMPPRLFRPQPIPLCGGPLEELESLAQIPAHALALQVKHAEIVLGLGELEIGRLAVPFRCLLGSSVAPWPVW